jgi:hypothetical protein
VVDDAGGIDDGVDAFELLEEARHRLVVGHVQFLVMNALDTMLGFAEPNGEHFITVRVQALRSGQADAGAAAGHDCSLFHGRSLYGEGRIRRRFWKTETRPADRSGP